MNTTGGEREQKGGGVGRDKLYVGRYTDTLEIQMPSWCLKTFVVSCLCCITPG